MAANPAVVEVYCDAARGRIVPARAAGPGADSVDRGHFQLIVMMALLLFHDQLPQLPF
jgi:hypothetical protein